MGASFNKSIVYPVEASGSSNRTDFRLRIAKESPEETNPTIYGNVQAFLQSNSAVDVFIDGVNLHEVVLIDSAENYASVNLAIQNSSIVLNERENFIQMIQTKGATNIILQACVLKSSRNAQWMSFSIAYANSSSKINLSNITINGGSFYFGNLRSFEMSDVVIQNTQNIAFRNVKKGTVRNCTVQNLRTDIFMSVKENSFIEINQIKFVQSSLKRIFDVRQSSLNLTDIEVMDITAFETPFNFAASNVNLHGVHIGSSAFRKSLMLLKEKSYVNVSNIHISGTFSYRDYMIYAKNAELHIEYLKTQSLRYFFTDYGVLYGENSKITFGILELVNDNVPARALTSLLYLKKSDFHGHLMKILDSTINQLCYANQSSITLQKFELFNSKISQAFELISNIFNVSTIRILNSNAVHFLDASVSQIYVGKMEVINSIYFDNLLDKCTVHLDTFIIANSSINPVYRVAFVLKRHSLFIVIGGAFYSNKFQVSNSSIGYDFEAVKEKASVKMIDFEIKNSFIYTALYLGHCSFNVNEMKITKSAVYWHLLDASFCSKLSLQTFKMTETTLFSQAVFYIKYTKSFDTVKFTLDRIRAEKSLFDMERCESITFGDLQIRRSIFNSPLYLVFEIRSPIWLRLEKVFVMENTFLGFIKVHSASVADLKNFNFTANVGVGKTTLIESIHSKRINLTNGSVDFKRVAFGSQFFSLVATDFNAVNINIISPDSKNNLDQIFYQEHRTHMEKYLYSGSLENVSVTCGKHFNVAIRVISQLADRNTLLTITCNRCPTNTYSIKAGSLNVRKSNDMRMGNFNESISRTACMRCPTGSTCPNNDLIARDYFHGFYQKQMKDFEFLLCPDEYCCSSESQKCESPTTCNFNRKGRFCGKCEEGYFISLVNNKCIENSACTAKNRSLFWTLFTLTSIMLALILPFLKDLFAAIKYVAQKITQCLR